MKSRRKRCRLVKVEMQGVKKGILITKIKGDK